MRVLVVDDNAMLAKSISFYLKLEKCSCDVASNGKIALSMLENDYDLIFLDLSMPILSGFDVIDTLSNSNKLQNQKIIILTAADLDPNQIESFLNLGVHKVLLKPISLTNLMDVLAPMQ